MIMGTEMDDVGSSANTTNLGIFVGGEESRLGDLDRFSAGLRAFSVTSMAVGRLHLVCLLLEIEMEVEFGAAETDRSESAGVGRRELSGELRRGEGI